MNTVDYLIGYVTGIMVMALTTDGVWWPYIFGWLVLSVVVLSFVRGFVGAAWKDWRGRRA